MPSPVLFLHFWSVFWNFELTDITELRVPPLPNVCYKWIFCYHLPRSKKSDEGYFGVVPLMPVLTLHLSYPVLKEACASRSYKCFHVYVYV